MISRRNRRTANPQEILRQFALNNSKGIDETAPPTSNSSVRHASNLIVNPDGSMSLRKPITYVAGTAMPKDARSYYLYDKTTRLVLSVSNSGGVVVRILNTEGTPQFVRMTYTGYEGTELQYPVNDPDDWQTTIVSREWHNIIFPKGDLEVVNLNSATVLGNCDVDTSVFGELAEDASLYDSLPKTFPRYIRIVRSEDGVWEFAVKRPEPNTLTAAEGDIPFNPNLNLDIPTSLRDEYNSAVPNIKGIVAYASSMLDGFGNPIIGPDIFEITSAISEKGSDTWSASDRRESFTRTEYFDIFKDAELSSAKLRVDIVKSHSWFDDSPEYLYEDIWGFQGQISLSNLPNVDKSLKLTLSATFHAHPNTHIDPVSPGLDNAYSYVKKTVWIDLKNPKDRVWVVDFGDSAERSPNASEMSLEFNWEATLYSTGAGQVTVADVTESAKDIRPRIVSAVPTGTTNAVYLKAFGKLPSADSNYYAAWFKSIDGIRWENVDTFSRLDGITVRELSDTYSPQRDVSSNNSVAPTYVSRTYYPLYANSSKDVWMANVEHEGTSVYANRRIDLICAAPSGEELRATRYRFKVITVDALSKGDPEASENYAPDSRLEYRSLATVSQAEYAPTFKDKFEFFDIEFGNTVYGKKLYHRKAIYSYANEKFFNNIFVSGIDSFITPLYNVIDLDTYTANSATCLVPWRDYLISATDNAIYLHTRSEDGHLTKTVNTSIGIPDTDAKCCKAILNGVIFKSGPKVYQMYPNMYSGDDSTLNLTEISKPVEEVLEAYAASDYVPFAFSTDSEYILMLPNATHTVCLRYDYSSKLWTPCSYPVVALSYEMLNLNDIRIFGICGDLYAEFKFDSIPAEEYADTLPSDVYGKHTISPIEFEWDTGQKTDNIAVTKQFVESKLMFATEDLLEKFPMKLKVHIDGDPHITTLDVNTDAPFWKSEDAIGVVNTTLRLSLSDDSDSKVFRQLIVRYSGKGKSIRHILEGSATSNFRLYETYVRYKTLNVKR